MYKPSGNPKVNDLIKSSKDRSRPLSDLRPIKLEELNEKGKHKRLCAWCAIEKIGGNQKYCSSECSSSAMAAFYPQKEDALKFLLMRQDWKCSDCKFDYRTIMEEIVDKDLKECGATFSFDNLPWYYLKRLKSKSPKEHKPEIDHIVPIYKGGEYIGLDNHHCLCYTCHKKKTKIDLSGKRKK